MAGYSAVAPPVAFSYFMSIPVFVILLFQLACSIFVVSWDKSLHWQDPNATDKTLTGFYSKLFWPNSMNALLNENKSSTNGGRLLIFQRCILMH